MSREVLIGLTIVGISAAGAYFFMRGRNDETPSGGVIDYSGGSPYEPVKYESESLTLTEYVSRGFDSMTTKAADLIKRFEGSVLTVYNDIAGNPTIGVGHLIGPGEDFSTISQAEADALLAGDMVDAERAVSELVKVPLNDNQRAALVSLVFNIGRGNFAGSTLLRKLNSGDYQGAANQFDVWNKVRQNGTLVVSNGLVNRRAEEKQIFLS